MPDENNGATGADNQNTGTDNNTSTNASDANNNGNGGQGNAQELTKEQLEMAFKHPRFKELADAASELKKLKAEQKTREEEDMKKKGEFEQLATSYKSKFETAQIDNALQLAALKAGVVDPEAVLKLVDRSKVKLDEAGNVTGVDETVKALIEAKPYLVNKNSNGFANGTNPADGNSNTQVKKFKLSQIQNSEFYRKNEADIVEAYKHGMIEDDTR